MKESPGVILTCQFTLPNKKSFSDYLNYITRQEALENLTERTPEEEQELQELNAAIDDFSFSFEDRSTFSEARSKAFKKEIELEAEGYLKQSLDFDKLEDKDFPKYISYMARQYALENKMNRSPAEEMEFSKLNEAIGNMNEDSSKEKTLAELPGVFSAVHDTVKKEDLKEIKQIFKRGQNHGSVIYQDVISHNNSYLEQLGLYDSEKDQLDEVGLKRAGTAMMNRLFKDEKLEETGFWMASIHRNTDNIHIHFAIVERENTRRPVVEKENGITFSLPKGKRRQATLDHMKAAYTNELFNYSYEQGQKRAVERRALLTRKGDLRNILVQEVKQAKRYDHAALDLLNEIYRGLPEKKSDWNYGQENKTKLAPEVRNKLDKLTEHILTNDVRYQEYTAISERLKAEAKETFGDSKRKTKDAEANALFDLKKRTGNSILTSLKQQDEQLLKLIETVDNSSPEIPSNKEPARISKGDKSRDRPQKIPVDYKKYREEKEKKFKNRRLRRRSLNQISRTINDNEEKYQARRAYEQQQRRIQFEQERR